MCNICRGTRIIRLRVHRELPISYDQSPVDMLETVESSREYPCPECTEQAKLERVLVAENIVTISRNYMNSTGFIEQMRKNAVHGLLDHVLPQATFLTRDKDFNVEIVARLGIVTPRTVKTLDKRIAEHQTDIARQVADAAIASIQNWGSAYNLTGIAKDQAIIQITEAFHRIEKQYAS